MRYITLMLQTPEDLRKSRLKHNITQQLLGVVTGLHTSAITRIESGKIDCRGSTLKRLSEGIDIIVKNRYHSVHGAVVLDKTMFENSVYKAILQTFEKLEYSDIYKGNGHHLAQTVSGLISDCLCGVDGDE